MKKKGQITMYLVLIVTIFGLIGIAAIFAPFGSRVNAQFYAVGESMLLDANNSISQITDAGVKADVQASISDALGATQNNINVNNSIFQYSWVIVILVAGLSAYLYSRKVSEYGVTGFT